MFTLLLAASLSAPPHCPPQCPPMREAKTMPVSDVRKVTAKVAMVQKVSTPAMSCRSGNCGVAGLSSATMYSVPSAKGLVPGFSWKASGSDYGLMGPSGDWYVPPTAEASDRLASGWTYTPTPELGIPRGYWESPCLKDDGCNVVEIRMPKVGQHGLLTDSAKLAKVETPFHPNDHVGGVHLNCKGCLQPTVITEPIPLFLMPGSPVLSTPGKTKRVVIGGKYYDRYPNGTLAECASCNAAPAAKK